ncbi:MAG: hypothetical protein KDD99_09450 [Bacteroidetes bacterium]|nr:hypothetical protein [Bacteroidota bacterium]
MGQPADFEMDNFFSLNKENKEFKDRTITPKVSASAKLYSYGETLSLVVSVKDDRVKIVKNSDEATDHIELWLALPPSSYPPNFEYVHHPDYIAYHPPVTRDKGEIGPSRFFSIYSEYAPQIEKPSFVNGFDYPHDQQGNDSLFVPDYRFLTKEEVHFGIVHFGLFPDGRKPVHYNREQMKPLAQALGIEMGDFTEGISYVAEMTENEDGYIITARISPQALGFVQLPRLDQIRFMVDIADSGSNNRKANVVLSSSPQRKPGKPTSFNKVVFKEALKTNSTDIPDHFFQKASFNPIFVYGDKGWVPTSVDVDALVYQENRTSNSLTEVKFQKQSFQYDSGEYKNVPIESLKIDYNYVNKIPVHKELISVRNQLIEAEQTRLVQPDSLEKSSFGDNLFQFPDKSIGLIIRESTSHHPYGWGDCGQCIVENIRIFRITDTNVQAILNIQQSDGPDPYCQIGTYSFPGSYVSQLDWIKPGKILVVRISHYTEKDQERVKVTWAKDGSDVRIEWIQQ